ncbi:MAG: Crp/Fnr family transcriptional regulator [Bacteroidetes bacterium]|nr:Crp/Fnr family transcriptional regulator [Bacteroidota bacterium]
MKTESCNLSDCFLCRFCIPEWKEVIAVKKKTLAFKKGELIFKEGEKVMGIFFLYEGAAKVHKQWSDEKELILRFTSAGEILGHRGIGAGEAYPVSATALTDSKACFITNEFLETTLNTNHSFLYKLMQFYAEELQKAELRMRNLAAMEVKNRIAETLVELHDRFGADREGYISVAISRQDIAAYSGTTYETVFKCMKQFTRQKMISATGKRIRLHDKNKLKKISRYN